MLVFCNGMPRSASTWSFNVTKAVLRNCFPGQPIHAGRSEAPVQFIRAAGSQARHIVMKCHSLTPAGRTLARSGAAKVVMTERDLPDAVVSAMTKFAPDFEEAVRIIAPSLELRLFHRSTGNAVIVHYADVIAKPEECVRRIAEYLVGGPVVRDVIESIAAQTSFERMRQKVEEIDLMPDSALEQSFEPETLLHRNHLGDGCSGKGRSRLSASQLKRLDELARQYALPA